MASELEWPISNNLMACASSLPLELIDFSIDFLHADMQSLSACSLVCRSWVPATRFHLFGSVEIHQSLQAAASRRHCRNPANTLSFIKLLESRDNTISPYIRSVMLDMTGVDIPDKLISALCNARVNITKLDITTYRQSLTFLLRIPQVFSGITNLEIKVSQALYHNTEDYARIHEGLLFAMSFPALHTLCFDASFELDAEVPPSTCAKLDVSHNIIFHHLHTLTLRVQDSETVIEWLRSSVWQPRLRKLSVHFFHPWHGKGRPMTHLNALLEDNSETLEDFTVIVDGGDGEDLPLKSMDHGPGFEQLNFSSLFKLHSLHLRMYFLNAVCDALESIHHSAHLETLSIHAISLAHQENFKPQIAPCKIQDWLWSRVGRIMAKSQFSGVKLLGVRLPWHYGKEGPGSVVKNLGRPQGRLQQQLMEGVQQ